MELRGKRVLITGAAGFIGSHLAEAGLESGATVIAFDDLSFGNERNLASAISSGRCDLFPGTVEDPAALARAMAGVDVVFHMAALNLVSSINDPRRDLMVNALGTLNVLEAAVEAKTVRVLVQASTGSVYGEPRYVPQDEEHPLNPVSPYGISKLAGERYVMAWPKYRGLPTVSLRYFNVYGPRQRSDSGGGVIPIFIRRAMAAQPLVIHGSGDQQRCFTYVGDVVDATLLAARTERAWNDFYNIGTDEITTIAELAAKVLQIAGSGDLPQFSERRPGDIDGFRPSIQKAEAKLGYRPQVRLSEGLKLTWKWLRAEALVAQE